MSDGELINVDDINYAVYKVGEWKSSYQINQIGTSREIPVTKATLTHVKLSMEEIRRSEFEMEDKKVNGFIAIALRLNPEIRKLSVDELITLEEKEYHDIQKELDNLELLDDGTTVPLDGEEYLIYKLEKEHHLTKSTPANEFTRQFYIEELKKLKESLD